MAGVMQQPVLGLGPLPRASARYMTGSRWRHANGTDGAPGAPAINNNLASWSLLPLTPDNEQDIEVRRKRASYRAHHRGTKEMDWLMSRYADGSLAAMQDPELGLFEEFLALPDPQLQNWIMGREPVSDNRFAGLVGDLRCFHGLPPSAG